MKTENFVFNIVFYLLFNCFSIWLFIEIGCLTDRGRIEVSSYFEVMPELEAGGIFGRVKLMHFHKVQVRNIVRN